VTPAPVDGARRAKRVAGRRRVCVHTPCLIYQRRATGTVEGVAPARLPPDGKCFCIWALSSWELNIGLPISLSDCHHIQMKIPRSDGSDGPFSEARSPLHASFQRRIARCNGLAICLIRFARSSLLLRLFNALSRSVTNLEIQSLVPPPFLVLSSSSGCR
jgi:hypothetical protein